MRQQARHGKVRPVKANDARKALAAAQLPKMTWYCATRHTYATQWVLAGGSLEKLATTMGHSTTKVTSRYAHLRGDKFTKADRGLFTVNLSAKSGWITCAIGYPLATETERTSKRKSRTTKA